MRARFLLMALGTSGDVHPFLGIGRALRERGHEVTVVANAYYEAVIRRNGLDFVASSSAEELQRAFENPDSFHPQKGYPTLFGNHVFPKLGDNYRLIARHYEPGRTVVVAAGTQFAARIAHETLGVPLATVNMFPFAIHSDYQTPNPGGRFGRVQELLPRPLRSWWYRRQIPQLDQFAKPVNAFRADLGLAPAREIFRSWKHSPQLSLGLWPEWFAEPQRDWPTSVRLTGFVVHDGDPTHADPLPTFIDDKGGRKPIVFTAGTGMMFAERFFAAATEACWELNQPGLLLTRFAHQVPKDLPPYVKHISFASFEQLLPQAAAIVHHGGIGTTARALAAGIPQVIVPQAFDQFDNASRLVRLGVARELARTDLNGTRLAWQLGTLTASPRVAQRCQELADRLRGPDAAETVADHLEKLIGRDRDSA